MFKFPIVDMVRTGENIRKLRIQNGFSVKDIQDVFGVRLDEIVVVDGSFG